LSGARNSLSGALVFRPLLFVEDSAVQFTTTGQRTSFDILISECRIVNFRLIPRHFWEYFRGRSVLHTVSG
jgi:hypothetical protein